jgi:hypothetical protein
VSLAFGEKGSYDPFSSDAGRQQTEILSNMLRDADHTLQSRQNIHELDKFLSLRNLCLQAKNCAPELQTPRVIYLNSCLAALGKELAVS